MNEFFADDRVRVLVNSEGVLLAAQNMELLLCDQNFYGWVRDSGEEKFTLETVEGENFEVQIGKTTHKNKDNKVFVTGIN